jgi:pyruvate kinase
MVARGDLGVELPLEEIPFVQADILLRSNAAGKVTITATEMLESMRHATRPTRAEVTDVVNAVLEGTDAVMLSGETATGDHPAEVVRVMGRILDTAERHPMVARPVEFVPDPAPIASATAKAAVAAAGDLAIANIVAFTETGGTARLISKYRPEGRIWAFSPNQQTRRRTALYWGVTPVVFDRLPTTDEMIAAADAHLQRGEICKRGEPVVMVAGTPPNRRASTNLMKVHVVGTGT